MTISDAISKTGHVTPAEPANGRQAKTSARAAGSDRVQLSGLADELFRGSAAQHAAKLSSLTDAVSAGRYHPDSNAVSASIIPYSLAAA